MNLNKSKKTTQFLTIVAIFGLSLNVMAKDWQFDSEKDMSCILHSPVLDMDSGRGIANIGMYKRSMSEISKLPELAQEIFLGDVGFILENMRRLRLESGVGIQISSQSVRAFMSYTADDTKKGGKPIYLSSTLESLDIAKSLLNNEDLTLEFNTDTNAIVYGTVSFKDFKKEYDKFNQCVALLE